MGGRSKVAVSPNLSLSRARIQYVFCRVIDSNVGPANLLPLVTANYLQTDQAT